jgi:hypothetical protein
MARGDTDWALTCMFAAYAALCYSSIRVTHNPEVAGSNPAPATHFCRSEPYSSLPYDN